MASQTTIFNRFKKIMQQVQSHTGECAESVADFDQCRTIPELVQVWKKYWGNLIDEAPAELIAALDAHYKDYADEINKAGVWYNELAPRGLCVIGNMPYTFADQPLIANSSIIPMKLYVLGAANVQIHGITQAYVNNPDAIIELFDRTSATVRNCSHATAHNQSRITISDPSKATILDAAKLYAPSNLK